MPKSSNPKKRGSVRGRMRKANIEDVEEAIEDERLIQKMTNKQKRGDLKDHDADELFSFDTKGSFEGISKTSRRELARAKLFPPKGPNIGTSAAEEGKIQRAENAIEVNSRPKPAKTAEVFDLWGMPAPATRATDGVSRLRVAKLAAVKAPGTVNKKVGLAPAVIPAHEGQSMNPHREAYEDLACMAAAVELERERENEELDRKMRPMTHELRDAVGIDKLRTMSEEEKLKLYRKITIQRAAEAEENEEGGEGGFGPKTKKMKIKAQSVRNKKKKQRGVDAREEQERDQLRLQKSAGAIGETLKQMADQEEWQKSRKEYRQSLRQKRNELEATEGVVPKKRKIGGGKYTEPVAVLPDAEAAARGMRAMPLRASAVSERFSSQVRRGLLPPPSEASAATKSWLKKKNSKLKRTHKWASPLLKDNLLLR